MYICIYMYTIYKYVHKHTHVPIICIYMYIHTYMYVFYSEILLIFQAQLGANAILGIFEVYDTVAV